jgi:hypothetical protein
MFLGGPGRNRTRAEGALLYLSKTHNPNQLMLEGISGVYRGLKASHRINTFYQNS